MWREFFDRRNACGSCGGQSFDKVSIATTGFLLSFTIVHFAAPGIPVPFVAGLVDCDGTTVRTNIVNIEPDAAHVHTGMKVKLVTLSAGTDDEGTEAVSFAFEPTE